MQQAVQRALRLQQPRGAVVRRSIVLRDQILHVERPRAVVHGPSLATTRWTGSATSPPAVLDIAHVAVEDMLVVILAMRFVGLLGARSDVEILVVTEDRPGSIFFSTIQALRLANLTNTN